jgi:hypothetical protein
VRRSGLSVDMPCLGYSEMQGLSGYVATVFPYFAVRISYADSTRWNSV